MSECPGGKGEINYLDAVATEVVVKEGRERITARHLTIRFRIDCTSCRLHQICSHTDELEFDAEAQQIASQAYQNTQDLCPEQPTARSSHLRVIK